MIGSLNSRILSQDSESYTHQHFHRKAGKIVQSDEFFLSWHSINRLEFKNSIFATKKTYNVNKVTLVLIMLSKDEDKMAVLTDQTAPIVYSCLIRVYSVCSVPVSSNIRSLW